MQRRSLPIAATWKLYHLEDYDPMTIDNELDLAQPDPNDPGAIADMIYRIEAHIGQLEARAKELREMLIDHLQSMELDSVAGDGYKCLVQQRVNIDVDLAQLPAEYTKRVDDKTKIRQALQKGFTVPGAKLAEPTTYIVFRSAK